MPACDNIKRKYKIWFIHTTGRLDIIILNTPLTKQKSINNEIRITATTIIKKDDDDNDNHYYYKNAEQ